MPRVSKAHDLAALADAHSHATQEEVNAAAAGGVKLVSACAADLSDWRKICDLRHAEMAIHRSVGIHPWHVDDASPAVMAQLRECLARDRTIGLGEVGLDGSRRFRASLERQQELLMAQLRIAGNRCVSLHCANAWGALLETLRASQPERFILHGCNASPEVVMELCRMGGFISIGPAVLMPQHKSVRQTARSIPCKQILIESDWLPGRQEIPSVLNAVCNVVAEIRNITPRELGCITCANALRICN